MTSLSADMLHYAGMHVGMKSVNAQDSGNSLSWQCATKSDDRQEG